MRVGDPDNYYIARANALENNVRFYRVVVGKRQQLGTADLRVTSGEWHGWCSEAQATFGVSYNRGHRRFVYRGLVDQVRQRDVDVMTITPLP